MRIPLSQRVPFRVEETDRSLVVTLYGATGDVDWMRYGPADSLIRRMSWRQAAADEVALTFELERPVWGYRARWDRTDLLLDIRRPPVIDAGRPAPRPADRRGPRPSAGRRHGPTGLREAEANLAVALELRRLLQAAGARVLMTRVTDSVVDLWPRVQFAEQAGADVLVSIHNNALPDGINPFVNNGTSVYYNQPRSVPARPRDPGGAAPPPRPPRPGHRPGRPGAGARHLDAVGADGGPVHDAAGPGGGAALGRGAAAATRRPWLTGSARYLEDRARDR